MSKRHVKTVPPSPYCADCGTLLFTRLRVTDEQGRTRIICVGCFEKIPPKPKQETRP